MSSGKIANKRKINKSRRIKKENPSSSFASIALSSVKSIVFLLPAAFIFALILGFIAYKCNNPSALILPMSLIILYSYSFACGFLSFRLSKEPWVLNGLFNGILLLVIWILAGKFIKSDNLSVFANANEIVSYICIFIFSFVGSAISNIKIEKRRRKSRRH